MLFRLFFLSFVISWFTSLAVFAVARPEQETNHQVIVTGRVALFGSPSGEEVNKLLDITTVQLASCGCELVERREIERVLQEQKLSLQGSIEPSQAITLGTILRADIFAFFGFDPALNRIFGLIAFDSATGARLIDVSLPDGFDQKIQQAVKSIKEAQQKRSLLKCKENISTICFLPEHNIDLPPNQRSFCRTVNRLLERYLIQSPDIIVLERQQLDRISRENMLAPCQAAMQLMGSAITIAGDFKKSGTNYVAANVALCNVGGQTITNIIASADAAHPEKLAQMLGLEIIESLGKRVPQSVVDKRLEGICFSEESDYLFNKNRFSEALAAANAACALFPSRNLFVKQVICQIALAQELFTQDSMARDDTQYQEGLALVKEAIQTRMDYLESANITSSTAFVAHLMIEWRDFHERLYNLWHPRGAYSITPPGRLFLGKYEYTRQTPETQELFLMSQKYIDAVIDRWADLAPADAFAMNTLAWHLAGGRFISKTKNLMLLLHKDKNKLLQRQESLGLKWLAALKIRGFDTGPITPLPGVEDDCPSIASYGDHMQCINTCASTIGNNVLWELIALQDNNPLLYSAMQHHPEDIVRIYALIGQLQKAVKNAKMPNESTRRQFVEICQLIQRHILDASEDEPGNQRRKRAYCAWFDLIRASGEKYYDAYYIELWQFMLNRNDVVEDILCQFSFQNEILSKNGFQLYDLYKRTIDLYNNKNMTHPLFLQNQLTKLESFANKRVDKVKLWKNETSLLDLFGPDRLACPVVFGNDLIALVDKHNELSRQVMRIPLAGGAPQIVGSVPKNWQINIISSVCANEQYYCIGSLQNGIVIIPLNGSPPWRITEENGLPARIVRSVCIIGHILYVGLNNSPVIVDAADDNSSFLISCDLRNKQTRTIAANRRRQSETPLDKIPRFEIDYIVPDSKRGRIVFMVQALDLNLSGLWQMDIKTHLIKKIHKYWGYKSWIQLLDDERFLIINRDWSLEYDLCTDTARAVRVTGNSLGVGDPVRANNLDGAFLQFPIDPKEIKSGIIKEDKSTVYTSRIAQWNCPEIMIHGSIWFVKPFSRATPGGNIEYLSPIKTTAGRLFDDFTLLHAFDDGKKLAVANNFGIWILNLNPETTHPEVNEVHPPQNDAPVQRANISLSALAGCYTSVLFSGIHSCPGKTVLYQDGAVLTGSYEFNDQDGLVEGKLTDFRLQDGKTVVCLWQDQFGTGKLSMVFSSDLKSFNGSWAPDGTQIGRPWNGKR